VPLAARGAGAVFAALSAVRGGKGLHPQGAVHRARLLIDGAPEAPRAADLLSRPGEWPAVVRFSRALGLPRPLPDLLGAAVRVPDAYGPGHPQDLLLTSSVDRPVLHHLFLPAADVQQRPYSSSLPFRAGDDRFLVGLLPDAGSPQLSFGLAVAGIGGRFRRIGTLHVGERLPPAADALRFNPFNCGGGIEPTGLINRLREQAYARSQAAWTRDPELARAAAEADLQTAQMSATDRVLIRLP
jgi:hypothetical protein